VEQYLRARRAGYVHFGYCCRLARELSEQITEPTIITGDFVRRTPRLELRKLARMHYKALFYQLIGHRTKPALKGGNIGIWTADFQRLNGFDENFRAWGCEDDDLSYRVRAAGLRVASILGRTRTYHLWHPPATTKPMQKWSEGPNVAYLKRRGRLTRCMNGIEKRSLGDLQVRIVGSYSNASVASDYVQQVFGHEKIASGQSEVELLYCPTAAQFSAGSDCRILVASCEREVPASLRQQADLILSTDVAEAREALAEYFLLPASAPTSRWLAA
jgi:hypothetical protein